MIELAGQRIFFGDFHGQWNEDPANPALLVAGLSYYGYDFSVFQGPGSVAPPADMAAGLRLPLTFFPGRECMYDWAHVTTWGLEGEPPPLDTPDHRAVLADLKRRAHLVIIAHPFVPFIPRLAELLDDGLIDAVELVNGGPVSVNHEAPLLVWYREQLARGRRVPIVGGLDIHLATGCQRPNLCYGASFTPQSDFDALDRNRTVVLADARTPDAIRAAVCAAHTLVEAGGELLGDPELVRRIEGGGYWPARRALQARLDGVTLDAAGDGELIAGEVARLTIATGGEAPATLRLLGGEPLVLRGDAGVAAAHDVRLPQTLDRNLYHAAASLVTADGSAKAFALKVHAPLGVDLRAEPLTQGHGRVGLRLTNRLERPVAGACGWSTSSNGTGSATRAFALAGGASQDLVLQPCAATPLFVDASVTVEGQRPRSVARRLAAWAVPPLAADTDDGWAAVPAFALDCARQLDPAWTARWGGPEDCSARVQLAWDAQALHLRAVVRDDRLCASPRPALPMFGDALQVGLNPLDRADVPAFGFYDFMLTRHGPDDRLIQDRSPVIACEGIPRPAAAVPLPQALFRTERRSDTQTLCRIRWPWDRLAPMQGVAGYRFGLHVILWDNDGQGCKAALHWPLCPTGDVAWYRVMDNDAWAVAMLMPNAEGDRQ